jgi:hypothetical protein
MRHSDSRECAKRDLCSNQLIVKVFILFRTFGMDFIAVIDSLVRH